MISRLNMKMQSIILVALIPLLLAVNLTLGLVVYDGLYQFIIGGFDKKLRAVSTVTAAFIDGDRHDEILMPRDVHGLSFDDSTGILYGADNATGNLVMIDTSNGGVIDVGAIGADQITAMSFVPGRRVFYAVDSSGVLLRLKPTDPSGVPIDTLSGRIRSMTYDSGRERLLALGDDLTAIDPATGVAQKVSSNAAYDELAQIAYNSATGQLYGVDRTAGQLFLLDIDHDTRRLVVRIDPEKPTDSTQEGFADTSLGMSTVNPPLALDAWGLAIDPVTGDLFGAADRLVRIDLRTGTLGYARYTYGYRNEHCNLYLQYVAPMRRIREKANLTYLYTQIILGQRNSQYILDATEGADHSPIGFRDEMPEANVKGARDVMVRGDVFVSDIQPWELWGLIKTAFAPIYNSNDEISAMAGADVEISIISSKTRVALIEVGLVSILALVGSGFVSVKIAQRLIKPIERVKEGALHVAAGQYGHRIEMKDLLELELLSQSFNSMSLALESTVRELNDANRTLEDRRLRLELARVLAEECGRAQMLRTDAFVCAWLYGAANYPDSSGYLVDEASGRVLLWLADSPAEQLQALRVRSEIAIVAGRLGEIYGLDHELLDSRLSNLFVGTVYCYAIFDPAAATIDILARRTVQGTMVGSDGGLRRVEISGMTVLDLKPTESFVISSVDILSVFAAGGMIVPEGERTASGLHERIEHDLSANDMDGDEETSKGSVRGLVAIISGSEVADSTIAHKVEPSIDIQG